MIREYQTPIQTLNYFGDTLSPKTFTGARINGQGQTYQINDFQAGGNTFHAVCYRQVYKLTRVQMSCRNASETVRNYREIICFPIMRYKTKRVKRHGRPMNARVNQ